MTDQLPAELVPIAVKLWLDMQTGEKRGVLAKTQCRCELAIDCPKCGRENKLLMRLYSGGTVQVECIGIAPFCDFDARADIPTLMKAKDGAR